LASENVLTPSLAHPFLRPGTDPLGEAEQRRKTLSRTTSTALVAALHVLFFFVFVLGIRPFDMSNRPIVETILTLSPPGNNSTPDRPINPQLLTNAPPRVLSAPITIIKPPPVRVPDQNQGATPAPGDVLGAVGRELACSAGSWEHLTSAERTRCGLYPWRGVKLPNGSLVMLPRGVLPRLKEAPDTEFNINSGSDRIGADIRNGMTPGQGGCPILQQTPCMHVTPGMRAATGDN